MEEENRSSMRKEEQKKSGFSEIKKTCLSLLAFFGEWLGYLKAFFVGQGKRLLARNEKEATAAELQTAKMQVEATDAAEDTRRRLRQSN